MSTRVSLNCCNDDVSGVRAHLYEECLESEDFPVFLELTGVKDVSVVLTESGTRVNVAIPRSLAIKLGLIPQADISPK